MRMRGVQGQRRRVVRENVSLVYVAACTCEDRRVGSVDEPNVLLLLCDARRDVLPDSDDPDNVAIPVAPRVSVEENLNADIGFGEERELERVGENTRQSHVQDLFD